MQHYSSLAAAGAESLKLAGLRAAQKAFVEKSIWEANRSTIGMRMVLTMTAGSTKSRCGSSTAVWKGLAVWNTKVAPLYNRM